MNSTIQFDCRVHPDQASYDHFNTALGLQVLVCIIKKQSSRRCMLASNNYTVDAELSNIKNDTDYLELTGRASLQTCLCACQFCFWHSLPQ